MKQLNDNVPDWVDKELRNWARYCWLGAFPQPLPPDHCESFEWHHERTSEDGTTESVDRKPPKVDMESAQIVQAAYDKLPRGMQQVLRAHYPQRGRVKLPLSTAEYRTVLLLAVSRVMLAFTGGRT